MTRRARAALAAAALLAAGCASTDYGAARRSRGEREYHGGAASVPERGSAAAATASPTPFDLLAFFGVFALLFSPNVDHSGMFAREVPITATPR